MLPKLIEGEELFVINIHDYLDGRGIHRVCVVNQPDSNDAEYFNSFGVQTSDVVVDYLKTSRKVLSTVTITNKMSTPLCVGIMCYFFLERAKGRPEKHPSRLFQTGSERADD